MVYKYERLKPSQPETAFSKICIALMLGQGNKEQTLRYASSITDLSEVCDTIEAKLHTKSEVLPLSTTNPNTVSLNVFHIGQEIAEAIRSVSILGRLQPFATPVDFMVDFPVEAVGPVCDFVGEGEAIPFQNGNYTKIRFEKFKVQGGLVVSKELLRFSSFAVDAFIRNSLVKSAATALDQKLLDPTYSPSAQKNPASLTHLGLTVISTGSSTAQILTDLQSMLAAWQPRNSGQGGFWIMKPNTAVSLAGKLTAIGTKQFDQIGVTGGTLLGLPIVTSANSPSQICLIDATDLAVADLNEVEVAPAKHASIVLDDAPQSSPIATSLVSLWERSEYGITITRWVNWQRLHSGTVVTMAVTYYGADMETEHQDRRIAFTTDTLSKIARTVGRVTRESVLKPLTKRCDLLAIEASVLLELVATLEARVAELEARQKS